MYRRAVSCPPDQKDTPARQLSRSSDLTPLGEAVPSNVMRPPLRRRTAGAGMPRRSSSWPTPCGPSCWPEPPPRALRGRRSSKDNSQAEALRLPGLACRITAVAPITSNWRNRSSPARLMPPMRCLPPVECSFGVSPSQAAKWRPDWNCAGIDRQRQAQRADRADAGDRCQQLADRVGLVRLLHLRVSSAADADVEIFDLLAQQRRACPAPPPGMVASPATRSSSGSTLAVPLAGDHAELGGMAAQRVDQLGALARPAARAPSGSSPRPAARPI